MKIYIAGPISGDPDYRNKFTAVADVFSKKWPHGSVMNPALLPEGMKPIDYMSVCLPMLMRARCAIFLPGWEHSGGAKIEKALAEYCGIPVVLLSPDDMAELLEG